MDPGVWGCACPPPHPPPTSPCPHHLSGTLCHLSAPQEPLALQQVLDDVPRAAAGMLKSLQSLGMCPHGGEDTRPERDMEGTG